MFNRIIQLIAIAFLFGASTSALAQGPSVSVELETIGTLPVNSVSIKGPRNSCGASKTVVTIERELDSFSPSIVEAVAVGRVFPSMVVQIGGGVFWFENVILTSYSVVGAGGDGVPLEDFTVAPETVSPRQPPDCD